MRWLVVDGEIVVLLREESWRIWNATLVGYSRIRECVFVFFFFFSFSKELLLGEKFCESLKIHMVRNQSGSLFSYFVRCFVYFVKIVRLLRYKGLDFYNL